MFESLFNQKTMYIDSSGLVMRNLLARQLVRSPRERAFLLGGASDMPAHVAWGIQVPVLREKQPQILLDTQQVANALALVISGANRLAAAVV